MALIDNKITDGDISTYGVVSAPDRLTGTANENKQVFDNLIKQAIKVKMNELINDLIAATAAGELGAKAPSGLSGSNIQAVLQSLKTYVDNTKVAKEPGKGLSKNDYTDADKALVAQIPDKAGTDNVLTKNNSTPFEPIGDYNPCTKKYADDLALTAGAVKSVFGRAGAVVAQSGDYTPGQVGAEPAFSILPVSKGGTGQSSLSNVTVGNSLALSGTELSSLMLSNVSVSSGSLLDWAEAQNQSVGFLTGGANVTDLPINNTYFSGFLLNHGKSTKFLILFRRSSASTPILSTIHINTYNLDAWGGWSEINANMWNGLKNWTGTQDQYDSITDKSNNTLYFIVG